MGFSVFTLTWNVDHRVPRGGRDLHELLVRSPAPDLYAIALQNVEEEENRYRYRPANQKSEKEGQWEEVLHSILPGYIQLASVKCDGILMYVFINQILIPVVENLETKVCTIYSREENGPKGAVAARFELGGVSFCFANCHLSQETSTWEKRDQEFYNVWDLIKFPSGFRIHDHDHAFMLGILNHRAKMGENFGGFVEGRCSEDEVDFPSTSRYQSKRMPPGPDRILFMGHEEIVKQEEYAVHNVYGVGEHKPVSACYRFSCPTFVEIKHSEAWMWNRNAVETNL